MTWIEIATWSTLAMLPIFIVIDLIYPLLDPRIRHK